MISMMTSMIVLFLSLLLGVICNASTTFPYYIGVGRYDITGPAAETNMVWLVGIIMMVTDKYAHKYIYIYISLLSACSPIIIVQSSLI